MNTSSTVSRSAHVARSMRAAVHEATQSQTRPVRLEGAPAAREGTCMGVRDTGMMSRMVSGPTPARATASRVAKWLLDKSRPDDAVAVLSVWAVNGPNDEEGQNLLAEALRIDPSAQLAKIAFERMEGIAGDHSAMDVAMVRWSAEELAKAEKEATGPTFNRAQVGFNNNVKYKSLTFHTQTADSGLDKLHIITHLFADGGRVIKSHKRSYAAEVRRDDIAPYVRQLMKGQQLEMALSLREGKFDPIIEGRAIGGMELLDYPPKADLQKLATDKKARIAADGKRADQASVPDANPGPVESQRVYFKLNVVRSLGGGPDSYAPKGTEAILGSAGAIVLPGEVFCHPREAAIRFRNGRLWLHDFGAGNGVFLP